MERRFYGASDVDAVLLATPHAPYQDIDYAEKIKQMAPPALVVDVDGVLDRAQLEGSDIEYRRV